jgi:hypothetical protein
MIRKKNIRENVLIRELNKKAKEISEEFNGAPVVVIIAGSKNSGIPKTITGWANLGEGREGRLRDLLGILEASKQIESLNHSK